jgi:head-tail adaptor|nr:MAG TPA: Putative head tail adaptor [Caudoviricetes sp.]
MSFGKMNKFIEIKGIQNVKDEEGFSINQNTTIAKVRGYREGRHGSEKWANRTTFTEATDLFVIRTIPGIKLDTDMIIICDDEKFEITSIENVKGKNMYIEILAKKVIQNG